MAAFPEPPLAPHSDGAVPLLLTNVNSTLFVPPAPIWSVLKDGQKQGSLIQVECNPFEGLAFEGFFPITLGTWLLWNPSAPSPPMTIFWTILKHLELIGGGRSVCVWKAPGLGVLPSQAFKPELEIWS